ncbi:MAG: transcriptional regulator [Desulfuromonadaceae bacterium]|nr:transcriptional regulator [Desulfuromonadaceae bacterium]
MIRFLIVGLLVYIGYRIVISLLSSKNPPSKPEPPLDPATETHRDPVCGVYVSEEDAVIGKLDGQRHYFCSMNCLEKYREQLDHTSPPQ